MASILVLSGSGAAAGDEQRAFIILPVKPLEWQDGKKADIASTLSEWVETVLEQEHARVAIIARQGPPMTVFLDQTGMTHTGLVFRHPVTGEWMTYSLYSDPATGRKTALLWRQSLAEFYYGQRTNKREAIVFLLSRDMQNRLLERLTHQPFVPLLPDGHQYNLISPVESTASFNCVKWVLLQLYAAREDSSDMPFLVSEMAKEFPEPALKPNWLIRKVLSRKPDVIWSELNPPGTVHTVTVKSLLKHPMIERAVFYPALPKDTSEPSAARNGLPALGE